MTEERYIASIKRMRLNAERVVIDCDKILDKFAPKTTFENMLMEEKVNFIMDGVCSFFDITREDLIKKANIRYLTMRKKYVIKLLYDYAKIDYGDIAELLDFANHSSVGTHYNDICNLTDNTPFADDRIRGKYESILTYLGLS